MKYQPIRFHLFALCLLTAGTLQAQIEEVPGIPAEGVLATESLHSPNTSLQPMTLLIPASKLSVPTASPIEVAPFGINPQAPQTPIVPVASINGPISGSPLTQGFITEVEGLNDAQRQDSTSGKSTEILNRLYLHAGHEEEQRTSVTEGASNTSQVLKTFNSKLISLLGRASFIHQKIVELITELSPKVDLNDSLSVTVTKGDGRIERTSIMQDSIDEIWSKLKILDYIAKSKNAEDHNIHLEDTLVWVDGVLRFGREQTAIHSYRVFFHPSPNRESNILEGKRRIDEYLRDTIRYFEPRGKVEQKYGTLKHVVLGFDTRGYPELKNYVKEKTKHLSARYEFVFMDDILQNSSVHYPFMYPSDDTVRQELNELIDRYHHKAKGLAKIIEGPYFSRFTGVELELRTIKYLLDHGWEILQCGKDLFDATGNYKTELDIVARKKTPEGYRYILVECKGANVHLPVEEAAEKKILYKLRIYDAIHDLIAQEVMGGHPWETVFAMSIGKNHDFKTHFEQNTKAWSAQYHQNLSFIFWGNKPKGEDDESNQEAGPVELPSSFH